MNLYQVHANVLSCNVSRECMKRFKGQCSELKLERNQRNTPLSARPHAQHFTSTEIFPLRKSQLTKQSILIWESQDNKREKKETVGEPSKSGKIDLPSMAWRVSWLNFTEPCLPHYQLPSKARRLVVKAQGSH